MDRLKEEASASETKIAELRTDLDRYPSIVVCQRPSDFTLHTVTVVLVGCIRC